MERIDHPKVFISYAWGSNEYQMKVLTFATSLSNDGVEVLLDKWEISAGNDMNNFMEKSVTDPTVTNVLILLDKNHAEKANSKIGGVGTETQIISQQVYYCCASCCQDVPVRHSQLHRTGQNLNITYRYRRMI